MSVNVPSIYTTFFSDRLILNGCSWQREAWREKYSLALWWVSTTSRKGLSRVKCPTQVGVSYSHVWKGVMQVVHGTSHSLFQDAWHPFPGSHHGIKWLQLLQPSRLHSHQLTRRKRKERLGTLPFKGLHTTPQPLSLTKPYLPVTSSYKRSWRKRFYFEQSCTQLKYECEKWKCKSLSSIQLCATPWTVALQAPLFMGFSRQEYWSGRPCPPPEDLPDPGMEPVSFMSPSLAERFFTTRAIWEVPAKLWEYCYERREKTNVGGSQQPLSQPIICINVINLLNLNALS